MKAFFTDAWKWIKEHKVVSIVVAVILVAGITCAIVLPITLRHKHTFTEEWKTDKTNHWRDATCEHTDVKSEEGAHEYNDDCDDTCNVCGYKRTISHNYDNNCDADCNDCGYTRTAPHTYDGACDTDCNDCDVTRIGAEHTYVNGCDEYCEVCALYREVSGHVYDNDCSDVTCNNCGALREAKNHAYDNNCDAECNDCEFVRTVSDHDYDNNCDAECNECGFKRTAPHTYDSDCDTDCNDCDTTRTVEAEHTYDNNCDAECNDCKETRTPSAHVYDNCDDTTCNECQATREAVKHVYDDDCQDTTCANCSVPREAKEHVYADDCTATECANCSVTREAKEHVYDDCDDTQCNNCAVTREAVEHVYANAEPKYSTENTILYVQKACDNCGKPSEKEVVPNFVIALTAEEAQAALDGDINGKTLVLAGDVDYGVLYVRIRPDVDTPYDDGTWAGSGNYTYKRKFEDVTIMGVSADSKATLEAIVFEALTYTKDGNQHSNSATMPYLNAYIEIIGFKAQNLSFTGEQIAINLCNQISTNGLTIDNCSMTGNGSEVKLLHRSGGQSEVKDAQDATIMTVGLLKDIKVTNCYIENVYQVLELRGTENVTITGNTFKNISDRVLLFAKDDKGPAYTGTITIDNNTVDTIGERFVRLFNNEGTVVISNNEITNYNGADADIIKVSPTVSLEAVTVENNTLGDDKIPLTDEQITIELPNAQ